MSNLLNYMPIFRSAIIAPEMSDEAQTVTLVDLTGVPIIIVKGEANDILSDILTVEMPLNPGDLIELETRLIARLTPAEIYLFGKSTAAKLPAADVLDDAFAKAERFAHATDYTHGKAVLKLAGSHARDVLSKTCGLNFYEPVFPNLRVKQSSVAKVKTLIARCDEGSRLTYFLHVDRSLGQYFWDALWDAGQEFGLS